MQSIWLVLCHSHPHCNHVLQTHYIFPGNIVYRVPPTPPTPFYHNPVASISNRTAFCDQRERDSETQKEVEQAWWGKFNETKLNHPPQIDCVLLMLNTWGDGTLIWAQKIWSQRGRGKMMKHMATDMINTSQDVMDCVPAHTCSLIINVDRKGRIPLLFLCL